ncbi:hypothetical protein LSAT2_014552 [Lamellibrachia satsuma]|nr:hypothetical protein LSAT2_014552 [Lamellibrachia satsuma]
MCRPFSINGDCRGRADPIRVCHRQETWAPTGPSSTRPTKRKTTLKICCWLCTSCRGLPSFVVTDMSSLPPFDVNSVDFGHIPYAFRAMKAEMADLRRDTTAVK